MRSAGCAPRGSAHGGAHRVKELVTGERLVEERRPGVAERLVRLFADGAGRDEDESMADGGAAGRNLTQELEPVDPVLMEVRDHEVDAVAEVLARLIGAGHGEGRAAGGLEMLEQDLLHCLVVLHDEDALAVEIHRLPGFGERATGGAAHGQVDRERRAAAGPAASTKIRTRSGPSARVVSFSRRSASGSSAIACLAFVTRLTRTCWSW